MAPSTDKLRASARSLRLRLSERPLSIYCRDRRDDGSRIKRALPVPRRQPLVAAAAGSGGHGLVVAGDGLRQCPAEVVNGQTGILIQVILAGVAQGDPRRAFGRAAISLPR